MNGLIVGADDLGLSPGVTRGILDAHRDGVVRSASLLVTFAAGQEAANFARAEPGLEVGLHLDLVGGTPASDPAEIRSLVDADGRFHRLAQFTGRLVSGRIRLAEIAAEIRAQAARAREWGIEPRAWDSHRHTHLMPPVSIVVAAIAREEGVRYLRRARPPRLAATVKAQLLGAATVVSTLAQRGVPGNDWFVDLTALPKRPDPASVALYAAYPGLGEIVAHPGHPDEALTATGDALTLRRFDDLAVLTDPLLRSAFGDTIRWRVE
ncbi:MAG TPA: ChbG/HpnK family deacetylase [Candidatus Limnocylindria bacterium]|nr:ChbG/HpnK family deacetylase [Candidatus Limnocylindria bacterium]